MPATVLRIGILAGLFFTFVLIGADFLLSILYPRVGKDALQVAFWGILIAAAVQPSKYLIASLETGFCPAAETQNSSSQVTSSEATWSRPLGRVARNVRGIERMGCIRRPRA